MESRKKKREIKNGKRKGNGECGGNERNLENRERCGKRSGKTKDTQTQTRSADNETII